MNDLEPSEAILNENSSKADDFRFQQLTALESDTHVIWAFIVFSDNVKEETHSSLDFFSTIARDQLGSVNEWLLESRKRLVIQLPPRSHIQNQPFSITSPCR